MTAARAELALERLRELWPPDEIAALRGLSGAELALVLELVLDLDAAPVDEHGYRRVAPLESSRLPAAAVHVPGSRNSAPAALVGILERFGPDPSAKGGTP